MKQTLLSSVIAAIVALVVVFCSPIYDVQHQVVQLPDNSEEFCLTVITHTDWRARPNERQLVAWFNQEPRLRTLRSQCKVTWLTENDPQYKEEISKACPEVPCVVLTDAGGKTYYKASGTNLPIHGPTLAAAITKQFFVPEPVVSFFRRPCPYPVPYPVPTPTPAPAPAPEPLSPAPEFVPETQFEQTEPVSNLPIILIVGVSVVAFIAAVAINFKKRVA